jgi:6-pyruvoyltetrahydropterin/6-carboxytetrahydropterin synthase
MYTVGVRDHIMVAHSLEGEQFGLAQRLHGATYTVSVEIEREELTDSGILIDIGVLRAELRKVLDDLDYRNLDEHPAFAGRRSTTEMIARHIHRELGLSLPVTSGATLSITLDESPTAWARYRAPIRGTHLTTPSGGGTVRA